MMHGQKKHQIYDHVSLNSFENEKCFGQNLRRKSKHAFCVR